MKYPVTYFGDYFTARHNCALKCDAIVGLSLNEGYGGTAASWVVDQHANNRVIRSYSFSFRKHQLPEEASLEGTNGRYEVQEVGQRAI